MKREDQIYEAADAYEKRWHGDHPGGAMVADYCNTEVPGECFARGAEWADASPYRPEKLTTTKFLTDDSEQFYERTPPPPSSDQADEEASDERAAEAEEFVESMMPNVAKPYASSNWHYANGLRKGYLACQQSLRPAFETLTKLANQNATSCDALSSEIDQLRQINEADNVALKKAEARIVELEYRKCSHGDYRMRGTDDCKNADRCSGRTEFYVIGEGLCISCLNPPKSSGGEGEK